MDAHTLDNVKQLIAAILGQQNAKLRAGLTALETKLSVIESTFSRKSDDLSQSVAESLEAGNNAPGAQLKTNGQWLATFERRLAT